MLADMFTQMVKIKEGKSFPEHPDNKTSAPIDLGITIYLNYSHTSILLTDIALKRSSLAISDQMLVHILFDPYIYRNVVGCMKIDRVL